MHNYKDAYESSLKYFNGDELAAGVFIDKYALKNGECFYELNPADMHKRLAQELSRIENKYFNPLSEEEILSLLQSWTVVPQGSPMSGIGNNLSLQSISNCFVIDPAEDSYGGIFRADQEQTQIMKCRGGVGHDISSIRPKGLPTLNAAKTTDGIAIFMDHFSNTTREVGQSGRRGTLTLSISVHHPEIETFINIKRDKRRVVGANTSIRVSDTFMQAVKEDLKYEQYWPLDPNLPKLISKTVSARKIWNDIVHAVWESAEHGILFWDTIIKENPADCYSDLGYGTSSTNPCGELPLNPYDNCQLLLLNYTKFVENPFTVNATIDYTYLYETAYKAQRLMDDMVDLELEAIDKIIDKINSDTEKDEIKLTELNLWKKIRNVTFQARRTGLGHTGLGDMIAMLNIKYGSQRSISITHNVQKTVAEASYHSSIHMAEERGAFPIWSYEREKDNPFINRVIDSISLKFVEDKWKKYGRRNIANLIVSPAGSMSILTQTTSGCEPAFMLSYRRRKKIESNNVNMKVDFIDQSGDQWHEYDVYHHGHIEWAQKNGKDPMFNISESPYFQSTAMDIDWKKKVDLQAALQMWIDHSVSNTINIPNDVTEDTVGEIYMRGWELKCKGITAYRD